MAHFRKATLLATFALFCALLAIGAALWLAFNVWNNRTALADLSATYADAEGKNASASSLHALLRDTTSVRKDLAAVTAGYDPLSVIHTIEGTGRDAGVTITVNAVTPSDPSVDDPSLASYIVEASAVGTFAKLYRFVALAETLPFPSAIDQLKLEKANNGWRLDIIIRVYSDAENAS